MNWMEYTVHCFEAGLNDRSLKGEGEPHIFNNLFNMHKITW